MGYFWRHSAGFHVPERGASSIAKPILYQFLGETFWMHPLRGVPDNLDLRPRVGTASPTIAPTVVARDVDMETALHRVQAQHSIAEVRILNWPRQYLDV